MGKTCELGRSIGIISRQIQPASHQPHPSLKRLDRTQKVHLVDSTFYENIYNSGIEKWIFKEIRWAVFEKFIKTFGHHIPAFLEVELSISDIVCHSNCLSLLDFFAFDFDSLLPFLNRLLTTTTNNKLSSSLGLLACAMHSFVHI